MDRCRHGIHWSLTCGICDDPDVEKSSYLAGWRAGKGGELERKSFAIVYNDEAYSRGYKNGRESLQIERILS